jgi:acetolactate synthase I/II/III large subunit
VEVLEASGVDTVFGLPGGTIAPVFDALIDTPSIRTVSARHESGAMFAAAGYAWSTGKVGVVLVTSGPGVMNTLTGLASAHCDGLPVLVLAGEVPCGVHGKRALQEGTQHHLDILSMAQPITKLARQIPSASAAPAILEQAIALAVSGRRGPVLLTLPLDILNEPVRAPRIARSWPAEAPTDELVIARVARVLELAERPIIFAGSGARWGDAPRELRAIAERLEAPVMTSPKAKGVFPEDHRLSLGVFGHGGHPSAMDYVSKGVDVVLAIGTGLSDPATNGWTPDLVPSKEFIQIDADGTQLGRSYSVTQGIIGQSESVLRQILSHLAIEPRATNRFGVRCHTDPDELVDGPRGVAPQRAIAQLQASLPEDTIFTVDIGEHLLFATHYLAINEPNRFLIMTGLASMGSGIGGAVGCKLANPNRTVAAICGDGGFAMSIGDIATAAAEKLPVVFCVLNDRRYGMVELGNEAVYGRTPRYATDPINVAELARAAGAEAIVIERATAIAGLDLPRRLARGPVVLDVRIDPEVRMPKNDRFKNLKAAGVRGSVAPSVRVVSKRAEEVPS